MTIQDVDSEFQKRVLKDMRLMEIRSKVKRGTATFADTAEYNDRASTILGDLLSGQMPSTPDGERAKLCKYMLRHLYDDTNEMCTAVQQTLDKAQGLHMAPQKAPFPTERVQAIAGSLEDKTVPMETTQRRARSSATVGRSFHDNRMKAEAEFRSRAGLKCYITRTAVGGCCPWCSAVAGKYVYGDEPGDVYRRHDNCSCTVIYENGRQRQDVWSKRSWEAPAEGAGADALTVFTDETRPEGAAEAVRLTAEQAAALEAKHGLTYGQKPDIINQKISDRMFNSHVYTDDEEKLAELGVIPFSEIEDALMASPIGRHVAQYIESQSMAIELDYISDSNGLSGEINDPFITVYVADMRTIEEVVETIVHETAHNQFDWQYTQEDEINCRIYEYLSTHDKISEQKIHEIVDFVREYYSDFPEGNLYGY